MKRLLLTASYRVSKFKASIAILLLFCFLYTGLMSSERFVSEQNIERRLSFRSPDVQSGRRRTVLKGCQMIHNNSDWLEVWPQLKATPKFSNDPLLSTKTNLFYCPVGKVASTFLTRWMITIDNSGPMASPFTVPIQDAKREFLENFSKLKSQDIQKRFMESSLKVVFGRNPFARVFSAYIEKMFRPNVFYWWRWGVKAIRKSHATMMRCGSRVNFQQFVQFAMTPEALMDKHMRPVSLECNMCEMYYDVIGKVESIVPDLDYISERINISSEFQRAKSYHYDSRVDAVKEILYRVFKMKRLVKKCISMDEMGRRIWRELEIRGLKDASVEYPFKPGEMDNITESDMLLTCKGALWVSTDRAKLKRQKKQAMEELYLTLNPSDVDLILKAFAKDFVLFGYSSEPPYLYDASYRASVKTTNVLAWNAPWQLP